MQFIKFFITRTKNNTLIAFPSERAAKRTSGSCAPIIEAIASSAIESILNDHDISALLALDKIRDLLKTPNRGLPQVPSADPHS